MAGDSKHNTSCRVHNNSNIVHVYKIHVDLAIAHTLLILCTSTAPGQMDGFVSRDDVFAFYPELKLPSSEVHCCCSPVYGPKVARGSQRSTGVGCRVKVDPVYAIMALFNCVRAFSRPWILCRRDLAVRWCSYKQ